MVPDRGDLVWLDFSPHKGHEQAGRRPGLVLSPAAYNKRIGLALICPITSKIKGYPFEVTLPDGLNMRGIVLADQVRSLDFEGRNIEIVSRSPKSLVEEVLAKLATLLS